MASGAQYVPGPASGARVEKDGERWTLVLVRELRHPPERVWEALTDPEHLHEWAPFDADGSLGRVGDTVQLTWTGTGQVTEATVTRANAPRVLEFGDLRWELEPMEPDLTPMGTRKPGTRMTLWHNIDRRFIAWGAAGWHICFDVLDRLLEGLPVGRIAGGDAMQFGWQRLRDEYAQQFGIAVNGTTG
jgi:uncharacterized protein YndB with AHSA1/START domain